MSLLANFISAIAILGNTSEMYRYGTMYWIIIFSVPFTQTTAAFIYVPIFHGLGITSAYEVPINFNLIFMYHIKILLIISIYSYDLIVLLKV